MHYTHRNLSGASGPDDRTDAFPELRCPLRNTRRFFIAISPQAHRAPMRANASDGQLDHASHHSWWRGLLATFNFVADKRVLRGPRCIALARPRHKVNSLNWNNELSALIPLQDHDKRKNATHALPVAINGLNGGTTISAVQRRGGTWGWRAGRLGSRRVRVART
jgi:hypothetical protein